MLTAALARSIAPLRASPTISALLLDLDGTLAPIVERPADARLLDGARSQLLVLRQRYALVGFVSGRALPELTAIVGLDGCAYSGNHGMEILAEDGRVERPAEVAAQRERVRAFAADLAADRALAERGVWLEDKDVSLSLHHRTATDQAAAREALERVRREAERRGLRARWGRKVLEVLPAVEATKGTAVRALLVGRGLRRACYVGDDRTDVDAWSALRELRAAGALDHTACIVAASSETAPAVRDAADAAVPGPPGVLALLRHLAA